MAWGRKDENERALLDRDPDLADRVLGVEPFLDDALSVVYRRYWSLRHRAHPESGIQIDAQEDDTVTLLLEAMDRAYMGIRSDAMREAREASQSKARRRA